MNGKHERGIHVKNDETPSTLTEMAKHCEVEKYLVSLEKLHRRATGGTESGWMM